MSNENLSDFLKLAYKKGKIKNVEEAFKEYPVEKEYHQGKIDNVLHEDSEIYAQYSVGDIVFVKEYTYQDGKSGKNHLFVIVDQNNIAVPIESFGMLISSRLEKLKYNANIFIEKDAENGLNKDSIIKTDILYKILDNQILFKVGKVDKEKIEEYKESFYNQLSN